ncbi:MAG TPA: urate oxidase [Candidatus Limnocylindrales bacterium]|nr:urate oxidase [Candidatus Limnocylindrales bacterium]
MHAFASGPKRNYYGKAAVVVYRLRRDGTPPPVFGASVTMLLYGDEFWATYTTGDNTGLVATDSMKNFIQRETANFTGSDLESYAHFLAKKFLDKYPQTEGIQLTAESLPYQGNIALTPAGPERAFAQLELTRGGPVEMRSGIRGFRLLRTGGSAFRGFVRDEYTTLPDIANRPLHMWLDLDWMYTSTEAAFSAGSVTSQVNALVYEVFENFESGSIQQIIYQLGGRILAAQSAIAEVRLEANNRTWDTVVEPSDALGIYTEPRPAYGVLGLTLRR